MANNSITKTLKFKRTAVSGKLPDVLNSANNSFIDKGQFSFNLTDQKMHSSNGSIAFEVGANLTNLSVSNTITANGLRVGGSLGSNGQYLASDGSSAYWTSAQETFEGISKNIKSHAYTINYINNTISSIIYNIAAGEFITKSFSYDASQKLTDITLSGSVPSGINIVKRLNYTGNNITSVSYI